VTIAKDCINAPGCVGAGQSAGAFDANGAHFVQTGDAELSILWDQSLYSQFAPFEVEGDVQIEGRVEVALPTVPFTEGLKLRIFQVGGLANLSQAQASIKFGERAYPARFSVDNGEVSVIAPSRNLGLFVSWINSATGEVSFNGGDSFDADRPPGWNGFSWDFGDGETARGYFPQCHIYDDLSKDYYASVTSVYSDFTADAKAVSIDSTDFLPTPQITVSTFQADQANADGLVEFTVIGSGFVNGARAEFWSPDRTGFRPLNNLQFVDAQTVKGIVDERIVNQQWDLIVINPDKQAGSLRTSFALPGDFNHSGTVDAADYLFWRETLGQSGSGLAADGDKSGTVDTEDYSLWRANFGRTSGSALASIAPVPEPACHSMLITTGCALTCIRQQQRRKT
jgi:hypothetical protein